MMGMYEGINIVVMIVFIANVIVGFFTNNIPSALGWTVAILWFWMYLDLKERIISGRDE